jgi:hypothetical protein
MATYTFPLEIRSQPGRILTTLVILALLLVAGYIYFGRMIFLLWLLSAGVVIGLFLALKQLFDRGPVIIINDEGIDDKRLRMGTIRWSDIQRVRMHGVGGAYFISLELLNSERYLSRQPAHIRISNQIWRFYNVAPVNIKVAFMNVMPEELFELIMSEVESSRCGS